MRNGWMWMWLWAAAMTAVTCTGSQSFAMCFTCGSELTCLESGSGGRFCLQAPNACTVLLSCSVGSGPGPLHDPIEGGDPSTELTQITVLEDAPSAVPQGVSSRLARGAGRGVLGREAARIVRATTGAPVFESGVVATWLGYGDDGAIAFRTVNGDGFAFERHREWRAVHLTVREVRDGHAGRVLADERLSDDDALLVRVRCEGQSRLLVLQAQGVRRSESPVRLAPLQRAMREVPPSGALGIARFSIEEAR